MADVAIVTDSNSGISVEEGRAMGVTVIPMPVHIKGKIFYEGLDITQKEFYDRLIEGADVATSQPAPGDLLDVWNRLLGQHREIVYIPMSAGLSASCATAQVLAEDFEGRVQVVDNRRISVTQRHSVLDALALARQGLDAAETKRILEEQAMDACIYITVDTLKYLRKGGRVTGVEAVAGTMLNIKPVLEIYGDKLNAVAKVRGMKAARRTMLQRVRADLEGRLKDLWDSGHLAVKMAYSQIPDALREEWRDEIHAAFPEMEVIDGEPLTLSIACHTGPGALGVGAVRI